MVLDSSAIVAIHLKEPGYESLIDAIDDAEVIGAPTLLETAIVLSVRLGQDARPLLLSFLRRLEAEVVAFNEEHLDTAINAFLRFGRGRHPAALILGTACRTPSQRLPACLCCLPVRISQRRILRSRTHQTYPIEA